MHSWSGDVRPIEKENLLLPDALIESFDVDLRQALRPLFEMIWNACGLPYSLNYDDQGQWTGLASR
jgi:hypothetical protein